ncbi:hypothetical protein PHET_01143 [Paragonimus heterotremus]|uniref:Uncharacterized protein n=1 Tax=Paragonimus heterotremus TaxID=100268 RepID=A0A8J4TM35_9TREM|nr:hypothetical protein PHET_01143 [Paragonimus heterotremus]
MAFDGSYPSAHSQSIDHGQTVRHNNKRRIMLGRRCRTKLSRSCQQEETTPQPPNFSVAISEVPPGGSFQFAGVNNPRMTEAADMTTVLTPNQPSSSSPLPTESNIRQKKHRRPFKLFARKKSSRSMSLSTVANLSSIPEVTPQSPSTLQTDGLSDVCVDATKTTKSGYTGPLPTQTNNNNGHSENVQTKTSTTTADTNSEAVARMSSPVNNTPCVPETPKTECIRPYVDTRYGMPISRRSFILENSQPRQTATEVGFLQNWTQRFSNIHTSPTVPTSLQYQSSGINQTGKRSVPLR